MRIALIGNAPVVPITRLAGVPGVLRVDGMDSERAKWPRAARAIALAGEQIACGAPVMEPSGREHLRTARVTEAAPLTGQAMGEAGRAAVSSIA